MHSNFTTTVTKQLKQHQRTCFDHPLGYQLMTVKYKIKMYTGPNSGILTRKRTELHKTFFHRVGNHAVIQVMQLNQLIPFFSCFFLNFEYFHNTNTMN